MIILMFFLELGYLPSLTVAEYDHIEYFSNTQQGYYIELGVETEWRGLFIGGSAVIDIFKKRIGWAYLRRDIGIHAHIQWCHI